MRVTPNPPATYLTTPPEERKESRWYAWAVLGLVAADGQTQGGGKEDNLCRGRATAAGLLIVAE